MKPKKTRTTGAVTRFALVALVAALLAGGILALFPVHSLDVWWHLRTGRLIVEEGRIPTNDPFTYTAAGRPWVTHEWLAEVLTWLGHAVGGVDLLVVLKAALAALALGLSAWAGLVGRDPHERLPAAALGVAIAVPLIAARAFVRPHLLTAVLLGATLLLLQLESTSGRRIWRVLLLPVFLLWANLHSGFVLGLGLVGVYWTGEAVAALLGGVHPRQGTRWRERLLFGLGCVAVTLINPNHFNALLYPFRLAGTPEIRASIAELQPVTSPLFRGALFHKFLIAAGAAAGLLLLDSRRRIRWALVLPAALFAALALLSVRGLNEFAVLVPALLAVHGRKLGRRRRLAFTVSAVVVLAAVGGTLLAAGRGVPMGAGETPRRIGLGVNRTNWPEAAIRFVREKAPQGRLYNAMAFGSWAIHELWPDKRVYIDGRLDVFPPGFLDGYVEMRKTGQGWNELVAEYDISTVVLDYPPGPPLAGIWGRLATDTTWSCAFFSDNAIVYLREGSGNDDIIARYGTDFDPGGRSSKSVQQYVARSDSLEIARTAAALQAMAEFAPDEQAPGIVLQNLAHFTRQRRSNGR